jgi:hypothetical protein
MDDFDYEDMLEESAEHKINKISAIADEIRGFSETLRKECNDIKRLCEDLKFELNIDEVKQ